MAININKDAVYRAASRENSDRRSRLVFIGMFDPEQLTAELTECLAIKADHNTIRIH